MKWNWKMVFVSLLLVCLCLLTGHAPDPAKAGPGAGQGQQRRIGMDPVDDRVQLREYHFADTKEFNGQRIPSSRMSPSQSLLERATR